MTEKDRPRAKPAASLSPLDFPQLEATWDDETVPGLDLDDPLNEFDRVTAIPELPADQYAKQVMESASAGDSQTAPPPEHAAPLTLAPEEYFSLDSAPPPTPSGGQADSTAPYAAVHPNDAPTARPAAPRTAARSPGVPPQPPSLTGLELADLSDTPGGAAKDPSRNAGRSSRDPRDPVLELSFDEPLASSPLLGVEGGALGDMKDRYAMGDFSGALVIAEGVLDGDPADLEAARYAQSCRDVLTQMYSARLGSLDQIVAVAVPADQIRWLTLDHRAGFLLSLIDGGSSIDQLLDISGMTRLDALRILYQLLDQRVISLRS